MPPRGPAHAVQGLLCSNAPRGPAYPDSVPRSTASSANGARTTFPTVPRWARPQRVEPVAREDPSLWCVVRLPVPRCGLPFRYAPAPGVLLSAWPAALPVSAGAGRGIPGSRPEFPSRAGLGRRSPSSGARSRETQPGRKSRPSPDPRPWSLDPGVGGAVVSIPGVPGGPWGLADPVRVPLGRGGPGCSHLQRGQA